MNKKGKKIGSVLFCTLIATVIIGSAVMLAYSDGRATGPPGDPAVVINENLPLGEMIITDEETPLAATADTNDCIGHLIALITAMLYGSYTVIRTMLLRRESDEEQEVHRYTG